MQSHIHARHCASQLRRPCGGALLGEKWNCQWLGTLARYYLPGTSYRSRSGSEYKLRCAGLERRLRQNSRGPPASSPPRDRSAYIMLRTFHQPLAAGLTMQGATKRAYKGGQSSGRAPWAVTQSLRSHGRWNARVSHSRLQSLCRQILALQRLPGCCGLLRKLWHSWQRQSLRPRANSRRSGS